jgi:hypothetical protein
MSYQAIIAILATLAASTAFGASSEGGNKAQVEQAIIRPISPKDVKTSIEEIETRKKQDEAKAEADLDARRAEFKARLAEEEAIRARPGVKIGMSKKQVIEKTSWGEPESINRTTTARGEHEQWVYGTKSFLYFTNGRLTAIQN